MTYHLWLVQRQEGKLFCLLSLTSDLTDTQCLKHLESKMEKGACQKDKVLLCGDSSGSPSLHKVEESTYPFFITSFVNKKKKNRTIKAHFHLMLCFLFLSLSLAPPVLTVTLSVALTGTNASFQFLLRRLNQEFIIVLLYF